MLSCIEIFRYTSEKNSAAADELLELDQQVERVVLERVVDPRAAPLRGHEAGLAQDLQVVRHRRLRKIKVALDVAHAELCARCREEADNLEPGLVPEGLEQLHIRLRRFGPHVRLGRAALRRWR